MSRRALGALLVTCGLITACARDDRPAPERAADPLGALVLAHGTTRPAEDPAPAPPTVLRVLVAGDLIPHRPSLASAQAIGSALAPLGPLFGGANAVIANYEAATAVSAELPKGKMAYAAPTGWLPELRRAGLTAVTVANNHACDLDMPGVDATLEGARSAGLLAIGGDAEDPWAPRVVAEANGKRVCAVGWTTQMNADGACGKGKRLAIASPMHRARLDAALARATSTCDATVAIVHGGVEYADQIDMVMDLARHTAERGADAVVVHHPHVASPVELYVTRDKRRVPLFASVGNLVSNQGESWTPDMFPVLTENRRLVCVNAWTRLGMVADLAFQLDDRKQLDWGYHLVWTDNEHAVDKQVAVPRITARLLDPEGDRALVTKLSADRKGPVPLFEDPCWVESPGSEDARAHRCRVSPPVAGIAAGPAKAAPARVPARVNARRRR